MKKWLFVSSILLFGGFLTACQNGGVADSKSSESFADVEVSADSKEKNTDIIDFSDLVDTGEGTFDIASPSGSTRDGKEVIVYYDKNTFPTRVVISSGGLDGSHLSFIYVDGELLNSEQISTHSGELQLQDNKNAISEGKHVVQLVQYIDDKEGGKVVTFKSQEYEIRLK